MPERQNRPLSKSEWTIESARIDHRMAMRIAKRRGTDPTETVEMFQRHVAASPACPVCREVVAS